MSEECGCTRFQCQCTVDGLSTEITRLCEQLKHAEHVRDDYARRHQEEKVQRSQAESKLVAMMEPLDDKEIREALECLDSYDAIDENGLPGPWAPNNASQFIAKAYRQERKKRDGLETELEEITKLLWERAEKAEQSLREAVEWGKEMREVLAILWDYSSPRAPLDSQVQIVVSKALALPVPQVEEKK